ncbi:archaemetzincin family Zn-dependent metalloprotease [Flavobacterium sp. ANB]|uniref:archaemetzincin family Zn-dependent metalloprotease n=1 Tax=unclassified Flavobacterium TaxID=196869 RepID=UPI0012BA192F|nr:MULTISPECIES: archaemetzincin family Zn-dependent metalloprotease [unclassified Flavobacterium]MBF4516232.1 archaemetzincin family Zn-dependent metalloprotease [Flavobacterium sp. ANB]MTD69871.1 archaemetzincin family Zn-dependent metalloprotease [Flavobacterium sp. LC2016-13]
MRKLSLLLIVLLFYSCQKNKEDQYFDAIENNDVKLMPPAEGEWLYSHKEKGQSFESFLKSKHVIPKKDSNIIYIKPIGNFTALQTKQIELTKQYLEIYFQLKTEVLPRSSNDIIPEEFRRIGNENQEQFLAGYILDSVMKKERTLNKIALMGLTEIDLYPKPEWNFVFGLASYTQKVGVSSIYRLNDEKLTDANFNLGLSRLLKICSHEIGHMFGLHHCIEVNCVMNGTNSLSETDTKQIRLCSVCQRKLNSSIKYDNKKRLIALEKYFQSNNLTEELKLMKNDLERVQ